MQKIQRKMFLGGILFGSMMHGAYSCKMSPSLMRFFEVNFLKHAQGGTGSVQMYASYMSPLLVEYLIQRHKAGHLVQLLVTPECERNFLKKTNLVNNNVHVRTLSRCYPIESLSIEGFDDKVSAKTVNAKFPLIASLVDLEEGSDSRLVYVDAASSFDVTPSREIHDIWKQQFSERWKGSRYG